MNLRYLLHRRPPKNITKVTPKYARTASYSPILFTPQLLKCNSHQQEDNAARADQKHKREGDITIIFTCYFYRVKNEN